MNIITEVKQNQNLKLLYTYIYQIAINDEDYINYLINMGIDKDYTEILCNPCCYIGFIVESIMGNYEEVKNMIELTLDYFESMNKIITQELINEELNIIIINIINENKKGV